MSMFQTRRSRIFLKTFVIALLTILYLTLPREIPYVHMLILFSFFVSLIAIKINP